MAVSLEVVNGVGPAMAEMLKSHGFTSVEDLAQASVETLVDLPGLGSSRAAQIIMRANEHLAQAESLATDEAHGSTKSPAEDDAQSEESALETEYLEIDEESDEDSDDEPESIVEEEVEGLDSEQQEGQESESLIDADGSDGEETAPSVWDQAIAAKNGKKSAKKKKKEKKKSAHKKKGKGKKKADLKETKKGKSSKQKKVKKSSSESSSKTNGKKGKAGKKAGKKAKKK